MAYPAAPPPSEGKLPTLLRSVTASSFGSSADEDIDLVHKPARTRHGSWQFYSDPDQTVVIFDWDDTLFPTSFLQAGVPEAHRRHQKDMKDSLTAWATALECLLGTASEVAGCLAIVTNAKRPWVEDCIATYAPQLKELFSRTGGPKVVYAREELRQRRRKSSLEYRMWFGKEEAMRVELTQAKLLAMQNIVKDFYTSYSGQSWKNVLSFGDAHYEQDALHELDMLREAPGPEILRTKTFLLPGKPSISLLTWNLRLVRCLLTPCIRHHGSLAVDGSQDLLGSMAAALNVPELHDVPWQPDRHATDDEVLNMELVLSAALMTASHRMQ
eukprot:TRINITY_DN64377_c0_g1_i1.p1 TRINITY_DN64377_c0_g1~~TRINITY_DN64377_c0_g1_i1.p1  ORF type:complete len:347 (+),score=76.71 TRINITY_DN64377_c0_g1_i1:58-1041(+)